MARPSMTAGHDVTAQDYIDLLPLVGLMTADQSVTNSTALVDATGLSITLAAGGYYHITSKIFWSAPSAQDIKWSRGGTATYTDLKWTVQSVPNGGTNGQWYSAVSTSSTATWTSEGQGGQLMLAVMEVYCLVNAGGTFTVQFAENVAGAATSATQYAGSNIIAWKLN